MCIKEINKEAKRTTHKARGVVMIHVQKSFAKETGMLYLVPTPIGNLEDITFRAIRILKEVDYIACEDTRNTKKLCNHFDIATPLLSYHEHNKMEAGAKIIALLQEGHTLAVVSDAGMPAISDPGFELVNDCIEKQIPVVPLPGANAALTAFIASGMPNEHFYYYGFLSRHEKERKKELQSLQHVDVPLIFYEAPHRLKEMLQSMYRVFGNRAIVVSRELTKRYEEFIRGPLEEIVNQFESVTVKGEFCIIVEGSQEELSEAQWWEALSIADHVQHYVEKGDAPKEAIKKVAKERELPKREVYQTYHGLS